MRKYTRRILYIAIPIMLSNLISQLQLMIDRIFIGRLSIESMSAVGNAITPMWTSMSIVFSLATGATILVSQAYGANEIDRAKGVLASVIKYNNVVGILLFLFWLLCPRFAFTLMDVDESIIGMSIDYAHFYSPTFILLGIGAAIICLLEVSQKTQIMVWYGVSRSIANIILDYALIFGNFGLPAMGVKGAALATTLAELLGDMIVLIYVLTSKSLVLRPSFEQILSAKLLPYINTIKYGAPAAGEELAWNMGNLYLVVMLNHVSVVAAGIHSIIFGVELIAVVLIEAIGTATLTLSGFETGSKNVRGVWEVVMNSAMLCWTISCLNLAIFILIPRQLIGLFTTDETVLLAAPLYLIIVGIDLFPKAGNIIFGSGIRGYGQPTWMLLTQLFGTIFIVASSSIAVLIMHRGIVEIFCLVVADETIRFILNGWKLRQIKRKAEV